MIDDHSLGEYPVPKEFWWAEGREALKQNWITGDFETWINHRKRLRAFGVSFYRNDIKKMIPPDQPMPLAAQAIATQKNVSKGGRPPADWWEDLLIDLCFKHYRGELLHKTQADIVRAMQEWITAQGYDAAESTIKQRARKLFGAIKRELAEN